jgi:Tol biopolymer transport system component
MTRLTKVAALVLLAGVFALPSGAIAAPGPIELISRNSEEQMEYALAPALSANGRYVAFRGAIGGRVGIFRKDLVTGALLPVVTGNAYAPKAGDGGDASEPSISADGRYVSFTTTSDLVPATDGPPGSNSPTNDSDVYVADLAESPPTFELASALNGSAEGLSYEEAQGSLSSGRVSLSADGREVVFVTRSKSNLIGDPEGLETPAGQVVVRDLQTKTTTLVSVRRDPVSGAVEPDVPVPGGAVFEGVEAQPARPGASISSDGSTVSWLADHVSQQVLIPEPELGDIVAAESAKAYDEPLWRRVPNGPSVPPATRLVGGYGDVPGLLEPHENLEDRCSRPNGKGAYGWSAGFFETAAAAQREYVPALSADGDTVALIGEPDGYAEAYVVTLGGGPSGSNVLDPLTRAIPVHEDIACRASEEKNLATAGPITSIAISPDARRFAFTTQRQQFRLSPPILTGSPPSGLGMAELYLVDLPGEYLERLTHGEGVQEPSTRSPAPSSQYLENSIGAAAVSFDASGEKLAFSSMASNLVPGDANGSLNNSSSVIGNDAFTVTDPRSVAVPGSSSVSTPPAGVTTRSSWRLVVRAMSRPDGSVFLKVTVPGPGRLAARAKGSAKVGAKSKLVAAGSRGAGGPSVLTLTLRPRHRFARLVKAAGGLEAKLRLSFSSPRKQRLEDALEVRFHRHRPQPKKKAGGRR